jgi:hypothetical protein
MSIRISHQGMFNDGGTPFALAAAIKLAGVNMQASFAHYGKLATRTSTQGEVNLAVAGNVVCGVFVDVSPKGDTCTVETEGYEWINAVLGTLVVGDLVTCGAGGVVQEIAAAAPSAAELLSGVWQVDAIDTTNSKVLINIETRL